MKRTLIAILALTVAVSVFAAAPRRGARMGQGQGMGEGQGQRAGREVLTPKALAEFLGLSETQITQAQAIRETLHNTVQPLRDQIRANQVLIQAALDANDAAKAGELLLANHKLREQIEAARQAADAQFEALLTAEQKAKWDVYQQIVEARGHRGPRN